MQPPIHDLAVTNTYVAGTGQSIFSLPCRMFPGFEGAFVVTKDGVNCTYDPAGTTNDTFKTASTGPEGLDIIFNAPLGGGEFVALRRQLPKERLTSLPEAGPISIASLNAELSYITALIQDANEFVQGPPGDKGDPGGNVDAIGTYLFATGGTLTIAGGTNVVRTSGYAVDGDGGDALFASTDAATYAAWTGPKFVAGLRYFILSVKSPNSYVFGVGLAGNSAATNRARLQAFFDHILAVRYERPQLVGDFSIDALVNLTLSHTTTSTLHWAAKITGVGTFDVLLNIATTAGVWNHISGKVYLNGGDQPAYANRTIQTAVTFSGTVRAVVDSWDLRYFRHTGIYSVQGTNNNYLSLGNVSGSYIGSGASGADATKRLTANWSTRVDTGTDENTNQLMTIAVDALPDVYAQNHPSPILVLLNGLTHVVSSIDRVNSKITVESWADPAVTSGTLTYFIGTVVSLEGSDANVVGIDVLDVSTVSGALIASGLYGPYIGRLSVAVAGYAVLVGGATSDAFNGMTIGSLYVEAGCTKSFIRVTRATTMANINSLQGSASDMTLVDIPCAPWSTGNAGRLSTYNNLDTFVLRGTYGWHQYWKGSVAPFGSTIGLFIDRPGRRHQVFNFDVKTMVLQTPDDKLRRYFGYDANTVTFVGTGANGAPSGNITFTPPAGHKINGGAVNANAVFGGFKAPVTFVAKYDGVIDWLVYPLGGMVRGAVVADPAAATYAAPAGGATIDTQARASLAQLAVDVGAIRTTLAAALAQLRAGGVIS